MERRMIRMGWMALAVIELVFLTLPFRAATVPHALKGIKSLVGDWVELSPEAKVGSQCGLFVRVDVRRLSNSRSDISRQ